MTNTTTNNTTKDFNSDYQSLKDYIQAFQNGDTEALNDLICFETVKELNGKSGIDVVTRLKFNDKILNKIFYDLLIKYQQISRQDIENWFLSGLYGDIEEKGILHQANMSFEKNQLVNWVYKRMDGHIKNMIKKERLFNEDIIQEGRVDEDGEIGSHYDDVAFSEWNEIEDSYTSAYSEFLELSGGLEGLLSVKQYEVFLLLQSNTQNEVAIQLGVSQSDISQTFKAITNRIKKAFLSFKTYQMMAVDKASTITKIKAFKTGYDSIVKFDVGGTFDYFSYVANWLKENSKGSDSQVDYAAMQRNKSSVGLSVIDVLLDNLKENENELFRDILNKRVFDDVENAKWTSRQRDKFVIGTIRAFQKYEKEVIKSIEHMSSLIVDDVKDADYDNIAKLFIA